MKRLILAGVAGLLACGALKAQTNDGKYVPDVAKEAAAGRPISTW